MQENSTATMEDRTRERAFRAIIATQCLGMVGMALGSNGFFLSYFAYLGLDSAKIALLFSFEPLFGMIGIIPFAFLADRHGKKLMGMLSLGVTLISFVFLLLAGRVAGSLAAGMLLLAIFTRGIGGSMFGGSWFALLQPIVPAPIRGRFFGRLRVTFQLVTMLFTLGVTALLSWRTDLTVFQGVILFTAICALLRFFTYHRIPELEGVPAERIPFRKAWRSILHIPGFLEFNSYIFLLTLFTASGGLILGLLEKDVLGFEPSQLTLMGLCVLGGGTAGCFVGGRLVDRYGTRQVFVVGHLMFALVFLAPLLRGWVPVEAIYYLGAVTVLLGFVGGSLGIAMSSELMALLTGPSKSLATALHVALAGFAAFFSNLAVSRAIAWELLAPEWKLFGLTLSSYDSLLLGGGLMLLLLLTTLGLVPSVVRRAQLMPQNAPVPRW